MKNLKKVLALVLAFACAFTMFAGAAFTDQADISQTEAVDMLSALGVINGYTDGSFKPDAPITRAQAAKMIYTIWNGGNDDASAFEWKSVFNDVYSGHWAEGYINFCYTNGIINGTSATTFSPEEAVTGTQLAKMLLICMGYQADKSGLEGTGYSQRTNALASQNGLYDDVSASVSAAMPRQYAAQIMYNALNADTVEWSSDSNSYSKVTTTGLELRETSNGNSQWVSVTKNETMGKKCMGLDTVEDILLTSVETENGRDTYSLNGGDFTRVATDYSDLIGQYVNIMIKDDDTSKVYGVYADEDSSVIATGVVGQLDFDDDENDSSIDLDGTSYDLDQAADETDVYETNHDTASLMLDEVVNDDNNDAWTVKLIDVDGDGDANHAVVTKVDVGEVTYVNDDTIRVDIVGGSRESYDFADENIYEGVAKDDWALVVDDAYTVDGNFEITQADIVSGRVQSVRNSTEVRIDGTWYDKADVCEDETPSIGNTVDLVVVGGMYFSCDGSSGTVDVAVVTGVGNWDNMDKVLEAKLMFDDGTEETVAVEYYDATGKNDPSDLDTVDSAKLTSTDDKGLVEGTMVVYDTDDDNYWLTKVTDIDEIPGSEDYSGVVVDKDNVNNNNSTTSDDWRYDEDRAAVYANDTIYDIADDAMIVILDDDGDYNYMTGESLKTRNDITFGFDESEFGYLVVDGDEIVALFAETTSTITSGDKMYGYVVDVLVAENADGDEATYVDMITADGYLDEVETDASTRNADQLIGKVFSYTMDGEVYALDEEDVTLGSITDYTGSVVRISGGRFTLTEDSVVIAIDSSDAPNGDVTDDIEFAGDTPVEADDGQMNALYVANSDGEIEILIVETSLNDVFSSIY